MTRSPRLSSHRVCLLGQLSLALYSTGYGSLYMVGGKAHHCQTAVCNPPSEVLRKL